MQESAFRGLKNRLLQHLARFGPGGSRVRVFLHRARGVRIGKGVWIGYDVILDTSRPELITIEDDCAISIRATIIAHFKEFRGVKIERGAFIGPGAIVLPNLVVGEGAVVKAGSVVSQSIPPKTIVHGNPAVAVARCEFPLDQEISLKEFSKGVRPLSSRVSSPTELPETDILQKK
jgi:acetyltransferase-like isoleucine patch superfamily enzyme